MNRGLWIDDIRPPPDGWTGVQTSADAIELLSLIEFEEVSFDHDLGGDDTTRPVILWLCEHPWAWPAVATVHSANPVGREWLEGMIRRYKP